ncbi:MAG: FAD-dependent oxidoreductase [Rhodoferax sp.]
MQGTRQLLLLGAGMQHLHLLCELVTRPLPGVQVSLVAPHTHVVNAAMLPGFVAGHYQAEQCCMALQPWMQHNGLRWYQQPVAALDAHGQKMQLGDGKTLRFDWLSIDDGITLDREQVERNLPGAREHALFLYPMENFMTLWPRVLALGETRELRLAVVGTDATAIEVTLALRQRLPRASVTLVCGAQALLNDEAPALQQRVCELLRQRNVTVLHDHAVAFHAGAIALGCGARLVCDVPLLANAGGAPAWLTASGLSLDAEGLIEVDNCQRAHGSACVFVAQDTGTPMRKGLHSLHRLDSAATLMHNLAASTRGNALQSLTLAPRPLRFLSCGERSAVASWGPFSAQGRWLWQLRDWLDRRCVARYTRPDCAMPPVRLPAH